MSKHSLEVLFDSRARLKILKFLFRNTERGFTAHNIVAHTQENPTVVRREIEKLIEIKLLKKKTMSSKRTKFWPNSLFEFFHELRDLILKSSPAEKSRMVAHINKLGKVKFAAIAGIFLDKESENPLAVDLFMVIDDVDRRKLHIFLKWLEAEVGKEIKFAVMDREEFQYRMTMFDRFVRALLEDPHEKLINKLGI